MIVYKATNLINGKIYIGKTVRAISHAKARHHQRARYAWKYGTESRFYSALRKHGEHNFIWEVIYTGTSDEDIQAAERRLIADLRSEQRSVGYNMTPGGDGGAGKALSEEHKKKLKEAFSGTRNPMSGKIGEAHPAFGHRKTPEQKKRISMAHLGRPKSEEQRRLLSIAKKAQSRFTEADYLKMKTLYEEGHGTHHIAEQFDCQASVVWKVLSREFPELEKRRKSASSESKRKAFVERKENGAFKGENAGPSKVSNQQRVEICQRRAAGEAYSSIAEDYPLGLTGIRAIVKDWGPLNGFSFEKIIAARAKK